MNDPRLQVYLARCGIGSRRKCEDLIRAGRVLVNNRPVKEFGSRVRVGDDVRLDGKMVKPATRLIYIALHKPPKFLCSNSDPSGRPLAIDLIKKTVSARLFHVGRLDFLSSGLIFYTNDGNFSFGVSHPSNRIKKVYEITTLQPIGLEHLERYEKGVRLEGITFRAEAFRKLDSNRCLVTLIEGRNREIRRVFSYFGYTLKRVHRKKIGIVSIKGLASGQFRNLKSSEIAWFRRKFASPIEVDGV